MGKIPQNRLMLYIMIAGLIPLFFIVINFMGKMNALEQLETAIQGVEQQAVSYKRRQAVNMAVINHYRDADHFYIDKYLETLNFLEPEIEALQKIVNNKNFAGDPNITKRLDFLTGPANSLAFTEGIVQSYPLYQETTETLTHSVEVNVTDIKKILARVEGIEVGSNKPGPNRPQLIILEFKIDKKKLPNENEVYGLNMKLLKREYM